VTHTTAYRGRKVIVTGAGGFIGSHLVEALVAAGAKVRALLRYSSRPHRGNLEFLADEVLKQVEVVRGDIRDPHFMLHALEEQEIVFHLAALIAIPYSYIAPSDYVATNVTGTLNLLESARRNGVQALYSDAHERSVRYRAVFVRSMKRTSGRSIAVFGEQDRCG